MISVKVGYLSCCNVAIMLIGVPNCESLARIVRSFARNST
jgi:hypothetical protein